MDDHKLYIVEREEKLSSIANKHNTTVEAIKVLNPYMKTFGGFIGGESASAMQKIKIPMPIIQSSSSIEEDLSDLKFEQEARYRCEQRVLVKVNGLIKNHATSRWEYAVYKSKESIKVLLEDNIIEVSPNYYQTALDLINEVDRIKANTILKLDPNTGKIKRILNYKEIVDKWKNHKEKLASKYNFLRSKQTVDNIKQFITISENQFITENNLIQDLNSRTFFDVFFDKYLVTNQELFEPYNRTYYSQLFDGYPINLKFRQDILSESPDQVVIRKVGNLDEKSISLSLEENYNKKFKPILKYKFSEYKFSFREKMILNTAEKWIEQSNITMIEEIKNNVQILTDYKLFKIE